MNDGAARNQVSRFENGMPNPDPPPTKWTISRPVSIVQPGLGPLLTRDNLAVQFNRDAVGLHAELFDERAQSFGGKNLALAIDG